MCLINITCDFSRLDFFRCQQVSENYNNRPIYSYMLQYVSNMCMYYSCYWLIKNNSLAWEHLFLTFHLPLQEHGYNVNDTPPSSGIKNELCLCMAFPINTYLYILSNYCLTENLRPSHTTVKSVNLFTLFLDMVSPSERVHIVSPVYDNAQT